MPSPFAKNLDEIQKRVNAFLHPLGFRRKGRVHNRRTEGGLVHVVEFQAGVRSLAGEFTANLGVLLPCVFEVEWERSPPEFVKEVDCSVRDRLGNLAFGRDKWWSLSESVEETASTIVGLLDRFGLAFLDQYRTYADFLELQASPPAPGAGKAAHRVALECALVANHLGDGVACRAHLAYALRSMHEGFCAHARTLAGRIGVPV